MRSVYKISVDKRQEGTPGRGTSLEDNIKVSKL
jgi:hypothetical protein